VLYYSAVIGANGYPLHTTNWGATVGAWKARSIRSQALTIPRTFQEFDEWFGSEAKCREYVRRLRWPGGFVCQECGVVGEAWIASREGFRCRSCKEETSLTAGTIFADTRKPLRMWFLAIWFVTSQKNGVSALGLQRVLGLGATRQPGHSCTNCAGR
jgi:hypothetical protein